MTTRQYSSRSQQSTLTGTITSGATSMTVVSGTTLLGGVTIPSGRTFTLVIDPDTALEEIVDATAVATNTFTITRAIDGSSAQEHSAGAVVRHMAIGRDFRDANLHAEASAYYNDGSGTGHTMHGIGSGEGDVVGTAKTQTLTNKTLTAPTISDPVITGVIGGAGITFEGSTADAHETTLTVADPTQDNTITLPNTTGTVVIDSATQTLTNKTLTSPTISGSPVITGLSSAGMISSSATPKDYVDSILGSATSAATSAASAATSAASAATSASSASTSASSALTSANSASTSATAAATSATSAAASATAAATSATSASNSASAASTSASSAATSASSALTSANSASTSASSALTSANSAATSASTMAASVAAAATSAASAATSATAAATSATSAAASATAAATSASSAATSASSALTSANSASTSATAASTSEANASASATAAATSATSAATSASSASTSASSALTSANSAATSASSAAASYDSFDDRYLGAKSSPPTVDNDGNALLTGALYWNTSVNKMYVWSGTAWGEISSSADIIAYKYTASNGQTSVSGADDNGLTLSYVVGKEQVYINGVLQVRGGDYTATTGSSITGLAALTVNDIVTVLAFTAFSVSNTIASTTFTAKGDILVASAAGTPAVRSVGTNDQVLVADSTSSTGMSWQSVATPFAAGKNKIINGDFGIWQRGTSFSPTSGAWTFCADRYQVYNTFSAGTFTASQQTFTPGTAPVSGYEGQFFLRLTAATTGTSNVNIKQLVEDVRTFAGRTVTLSFWAKASADRSVDVFIRQNFGSGGSASVDSSPATVTVTTAWQRFTYTVTLGSMSGKTIGTGSSLEIWPATSTNFTGGSTLDFWGWQLEAGSVATPFTTATGTIQGELAACQRYYWRWTAGDAYTPYGMALKTTATAAQWALQFPVEMRARVTSLEFSSLISSNAAGNGAITAMTLGWWGKNTARIDITNNSIGVADTPTLIQSNNNSSAYFAINAEL